MSQQDLKAKACAAYVAAKKDGKSNVAAKAIAGNVCKIGHSLCDLAWYAERYSTMPSVPVGREIRFDDKGKCVEGLELAQCIVALRGGAGWKGQYEGDRMAWGPISIALGWFSRSNPSTAGENLVQRLFPLATKAVAGEAVAAEGTRTGKGGRFLHVNGAPEPRLYLGNHKSHGVEVDRPRAVDVKAVVAEADTYQGKVVQFAAGKKAAAQRTRKPRTPKA